MKLLSINVSLPRTVSHNGNSVMTGIFKQAVAGPVALHQENLEGDGQADLRVHGGTHKAVYVYPYEHYAYWQEQLQRSDFAYGQFGENLTVSGLLEDDVHIGDSLRIGDAELQVTQPRTPCFKLGIKMGLPDFPKTFMASGRMGFYLSVLKTGTLEAGQAISWIERDPAAISVTQAWRLFYLERDNIDGIRALLAVKALAPSWRESFEKRLQAMGALG